MKFVIQEGGKYIACSISRNGKNEIRFYKISQENGFVSSTVINSIFLDSSIIDIVWSTTTSMSKKRRNNSTNEDISQDETLIVLDQSGDLIVLSPLSNKEIKRYSTKVEGSKLIKVDNFIWIKSKDHIIKYSSDDNSTSTIPVSSETAIVLSGSKSVRVARSEEKLFLGKIVKHKFVKEHEIEISQVKQILQSKTKPDFIAVLANELYVVNLKNPQDYYKIDYNGCKSVLSTVTYDNEEYIQVATESKTYLVKFGDREISKTITSSNNITELFTFESNLIGAWKDLNDVQISNINWISETEGEIINKIKPNIESSQPNTKIHIPKITAINNIFPEELLPTLIDRLNETNKNSIIKLCSSINNEETIKQTIKSLVFEQENNNYIDKLYSIISTEVAKDCSINKSLGIWLKWILLTYGGIIAKSEQFNTKTLQKELSSGIELLPHLIAIQGKLQLLTLQSEIRQKVIDIEESTEETNIVYANGEGDDEIVEDIEVA